MSHKLVCPGWPAMTMASRTSPAISTRASISATGPSAGTATRMNMNDAPHRAATANSNRPEDETRRFGLVTCQEIGDGRLRRQTCAMHGNMRQTHEPEPGAATSACRRGGRGQLHSGCVGTGIDPVRDQPCRRVPRARARPAPDPSGPNRRRGDRARRAHPDPRSGGPAPGRPHHRRGGRRRGALPRPATACRSPECMPPATCPDRRVRPSLPPSRGRSARRHRHRGDGLAPRRDR